MANHKKVPNRKAQTAKRSPVIGELEFEIFLELVIWDLFFAALSREPQ
ncbi:MAG TPA: hypothetical protein VH518_23420 [Tepidisphaeraceae bacterium]|jgi:hypothetical protein